MRILRNQRGWSDMTATVVMLMVLLICIIIPCIIGILH